MRVIDRQNGIPEFAVPIDNVDIAFVGQCVKWGGDGCLNIGTASGAFDTTTEAIIAGIVRGENTISGSEAYEDGSVVSGFSGRKVTGVSTQAAQVARNIQGNSGMYSKRDKQVILFLDTLDIRTRIEAAIFNAAYGTAPTLLTATTANTAGTTIVHNTADFTPAAGDLSTIYCRSGANAGIYRVCQDTSLTTTTVTQAFENDIAIGDTFIKVNVRQGACRMQTDGEGLYINTGADLSSDYWGIIVESLDLRIANQEKAVFRFSPLHFLGAARS